MARFNSNLASGQPAAQSSEGRGDAAAHANDGDTDSNFWSNLVTRTRVDSHACWQTDLGGVRTIGSVQLWNRTDCLIKRLVNFYVQVSDAPFNSTNLQTTLNQPGVSSHYTAGQGSDVLSLAEVQVWER